MPILIKTLFIIAGTISLVLGVLGIIIPGLPTTPFLLLTAYLYARGSEKLYRLLVGNKFLGPYIHKYQRQKGMTMKTKIKSIILMWIMILLSVIFLITSLPVKLVAIGLGITGTVVMGFIVHTYKDPVNQLPCAEGRTATIFESG